MTLFYSIQALIKTENSFETFLLLLNRNETPILYIVRLQFFLMWAFSREITKEEMII